jgi:hypothetical protein
MTIKSHMPWKPAGNAERPSRRQRTPAPEWRYFSQTAGAIPGILFGGLPHTRSGRPQRGLPWFNRVRDARRELRGRR